MQNIIVGTDQIIGAQTCVEMAQSLDMLVETIALMTKAGQRKAIQTMKNHLRAFLVNQDEKHHLIKRTPYRIVTGMEANIICIVCELGDEPEHNTQRALSKMDSLVEALLLTGGTGIGDLEINHVEQILKHCDRITGCLSALAPGLLTIAFPDIDINCIAECDGNADSGLTMIINGSTTNSGLTESMVYEAVAITIAGDSVPPDALQLMSRTTLPSCSQETEECQYFEYLQAIKYGLSYHGPFANIVADSISADVQEAWYDYIISLFHTQTSN